MVKTIAIGLVALGIIFIFWLWWLGGRAPDEITLRSYGRELMRAMAPYATQDEAGELTLALRVIESRQPAEIEKISRLRERHLAVARNLMALAVPQAAAELHQTLIDRLLGLAELDGRLGQILEQPVAALEAGEKYPARYTELLAAINELNRFFVSRQIVFSPDEQAKIFIKP